MLRYLTAQSCAGTTLALLGGCALHAPFDSAKDLQARLASRPSATATLQSACPSPIHVRTMPISASLAPPAEVIEHLDVASAQLLKVRHVQLLCGETPLSDAWNWYVPSRLTPEMNDTLEHSTTPFGRAVQATHFSRTTISSTLMPPSSIYVLENRAILRRASDNAPIALVIEDYLPAATRNGR